MDKYLSDILINRIRDDAYADDLSINIFAKDLVGFARLQNMKLPCLSGSDASAPSACACENNVGHCKCNVVRPNDNIDHELTEYFRCMRNISDKLLLELCRKLLQILNYSGFKLKHLLVGEHLQPEGDALLKEQDAYEVLEERRQRHRPSQEELREHMELLTNRHSSLKISQITQEEKLCGQRTGIQHLGSLYRTTEDEEQIELVNQSLSFIYISADRKSLRCRSPDFFSYSSFEIWSKEAKPIYSKRSISSLIAKNADYSGNFLVLYKTKLKTLLRIFLQRNPTAKWDDVLTKDESDKLIHSLKSYFVLVRNTKHSPVTLKLHYARHHLYLCSDASEHIVACSLSLVSEYTVNGIKRYSATHLSLQSYSVHVNISNIPKKESLALIRGLCELQLYLKELRSLGYQVNPENIYVCSDSQIVICLLRQRVQQLKKVHSHTVSKMHLLLHDMQLTPWKKPLFWRTGQD